MNSKVLANTDLQTPEQLSAGEFQFHSSQAWWALDFTIL